MTEIHFKDKFIPKGKRQGREKINDRKDESSLMLCSYNNISLFWSSSLVWPCLGLVPHGLSLKGIIGIKSLSCVIPIVIKTNESFLES